MDRYEHDAIEKKWQERWEREGADCAEDASKKPKEYILVEFPYPSGSGIHMGHVRSYTAFDVVARKKRMEGKNVLYPIGYDAFGLPTENYALKTGRHPADITKENIATFERQMKALGLSFDWSRTVNTSDPAYYKWTQWIFLQLLKKGLAYQDEIAINWCPKDKIGLANEEVVGGKCERCGTPVVKKMQKQWMLKITAYAERLLKDLDTVDYLPHIKEQQVNWIGKSEGLIFTSPVKGMGLVLETFSTHFESFFADTFIVIASDHPLLQKLVEELPNAKEVLSAAEEMTRKRMQQGREEVKEVEGIFTGRYTLDPIGNGELPIWIANFALADYGTGIVKCSAHDERDFAFAKKYGIRLKPVLFPTDVQQRKKVEDLEVCFTDMQKGVLLEPKEFEGKIAGTHRDAIADYAIEKGYAQKTVMYKLRDWVFSRQHYWGEPIPVIHCPKDGVVPIPEKDLPVELPHVEKYQPTDTGESPLANITEWVNTTCPECGGPAKRETDTMPNWAGSSWYYLRYCDPHNDAAFADKKKLNYWLPVDLYNGGMEHTVLHLLYSRFWHKFLFDEGLMPNAEPYRHRHSHGIVLGEDGQKMSKSRGNVIRPDELVEEYGADSVRLYELFMGPFEDMIPWSHRGIVGCRRFLERVSALRERVVIGPIEKTTALLLHQTIKKVGDDVAAFHFNTAVSALMIFSNHLQRLSAVPASAWQPFLALLFPFAPHLASELWESGNFGGRVEEEAWPTPDSSKLTTETFTLVVQVNGKVRSRLTLPSDVDQEKALAYAMDDANVKKFVMGEPKSVVFVKGKLLNIVL